MRCVRPRPGRARRRRSAFSLTELVVVVIILGVVAAIAAPRVSTGAKSAACAALVADLASLRKAIELYAIDHEGIYPNETSGAFTAQLTKYTDSGGTLRPRRIRCTGTVRI